MPGVRTSSNHNPNFYWDPGPAISRPQLVAMARCPFLLPTKQLWVWIRTSSRFFSLLLSLWTVFRSNPSSVKEWISQMELAVMSRAKYYKNWPGVDQLTYWACQWRSSWCRRERWSPSRRRCPRRRGWRGRERAWCGGRWNPGMILISNSAK